MIQRIGVKLEDYKLTPAQIALVEWMKKIGYGEISIKFQNGDPSLILSPTSDGFGKQSILITELIKQRT
jgi:hypothetical protein